MKAPSAQPSSRKLIGELIVVTLALLVAGHILYRFRGAAVVGPAVSTIVAVLFLYAPVIVLWVRRRPIDFLDRGWTAWRRSLLTFLIVAIVIFPLFFLVAHFWQVYVWHRMDFHWASFPNLLHTAAFQIVLVALPEEFYFRGYFQSTMDAICKKRWRLFGVDLGWAWIITAVIFAIAHTLIVFRWWHFSIFFPALVFGWLRERTGSITAPILFHATSNLLMDWFARCYL